MERLAGVGVVVEGLDACWGEVEYAVIDDHGQLRLDPRAGDGEVAARVGHLLLHRGLAEPDRGEGCVRAWVEREAAAYAYELELRSRLAVTTPLVRYGFEAGVAEAPDSGAEQVIEGWLWNHPRGGEGVDALVEAYRGRCSP